MAKEKIKKTLGSKSSEMDGKNEAALNAIEQIRSKFGEGSIMRFGEMRKTNVDAIPTGCLSLDLATGIGGVPEEEL